MLINQIKTIKNKVIFIPYWEGCDYVLVLEDKILAKDIKEKLTKDIEEYSFNKGSYYRYFINGFDVIIINIGKIEKITIEEIRKFASLIFNKACELFLKNFDVLLFSKIWKINKDELLEGFLEGFFLTDYSFNKYKKREKEFKIKEINIINDEFIDNFNKITEKTKNITESVKFCRDLINEPSNICTISYIEKVVKKIAKENSLTINVFKANELKKLGMNLLLAVGKGGSEEPRLIEVAYRCSDKFPHIALVGKGIVFDTGGINLKPSGSLDDMKADMAGAACVVSIIYAISKLKLPVNVTGVLPLAENSVDSNSCKPGDVVIAYNKKSVEIKNCDAEGRLILADALAYIDSKKPDVIIDIATLTGAAIIALGTKITAGFFKNSFIKEIILEASQETGEVIWELPLFNEYKDMIKNDITDLKNVGEPQKEAGTIIGALFLEEFVTNQNWVHLDIAGPSFIKSDSFYLRKGATGIMVRTIVRFIEKYLIKAYK